MCNIDTVESAESVKSPSKLIAVGSTKPHVTQLENLKKIQGTLISHTNSPPNVPLALLDPTLLSCWEEMVNEEKSAH